MEVAIDVFDHTIIIGAGVAGLSAAEELVRWIILLIIEQFIKYLYVSEMVIQTFWFWNLPTGLEVECGPQKAKVRTTLFIWTTLYIFTEGFAVDLGGRWIHGKDNSIFSFSESNGILGKNIEIEDADAVYNDARFYSSTGKKISDELAYYGFLSLEQVFQWISSIITH